MMNIQVILVNAVIGCIILAMLVLAVRYMIRKRKAGGCSGCAGCSGNCAAKKVKK